jgi:hypothetical protein
MQAAGRHWNCTWDFAVILPVSSSRTGSNTHPAASGRVTTRPHQAIFRSAPGPGGFARRYMMVISPGYRYRIKRPTHPLDPPMGTSDDEVTKNRMDSRIVSVAAWLNQYSCGVATGFVARMIASAGSAEAPYRPLRASPEALHCSAIGDTGLKDDPTAREPQLANNNVMACKSPPVPDGGRHPAAQPGVPHWLLDPAHISGTAAIHGGSELARPRDHAERRAARKRPPGSATRAGQTQIPGYGAASSRHRAEYDRRIPLQKGSLKDAGATTAQAASASVGKAAPVSGLARRARHQRGHAQQSPAQIDRLHRPLPSAETGKSRG